MLQEAFAANRLLLSRLFGIILLLFITFSAPPWDLGGYVALSSELTGFLLLMVATCGRIWATIYIAGFKDDALITEGPYSIVRNPLYLFSFVGALGFGLAVEHPIAGIIILVLFLAFYPTIVRREEERLIQLFGSDFVAYCQRTPKWIPRFRHYHQLTEYTINLRRATKGIISSMWFVFAFLLWEVIERLQAHEVIPILWYD